jgi:hypothetical protein
MPEPSWPELKDVLEDGGFAELGARRRWALGLKHLTIRALEIVAGAAFREREAG